jgi:hypothetical protein
MEVLATIGLVGLAGKYISDRFNNNTDDNYIDDQTENDNTIEVDKNYSIQETYSTTTNGFDQKKRVQDTMDSVTKEKKILSDDPHNKNIIPPLFNKRVYSLDTENKYLSSAKGNQFNNTRGESMLDIYKNDRNLMEGPVNTLTTLDEQFSPITIVRNQKPVAENQGKLTLPSNWTPFKQGDDDMTYKIFNKDELIHNNMQPFFKDRGQLITQENSRNMEQTLDIYTGSSRFYFAKREVPNIVENFEGGFSTAYQPIPQLSYTRGTPVQIDLIKDRYFSGKEKKNDLPFEQVRVTPGLNIGAYEDGKVGFQDPYQPQTSTIDDLRRKDNPQLSATEPSIPGAHGFGKSAIIGDVVNKKPQTYGTLGVDYETFGNYAEVNGPTDQGNFNFDKAHRGKKESVEQGPAGSNNKEIIPDISNFGKINDPFKRLMPGFVQSVPVNQTSIPVLDPASYNNPITQRSTANSQYTGGMSKPGGEAGDMSEYQSMITNRITTNANYTGALGGSSAGDMSEYQSMATNRVTTQDNFTGGMGGAGGVGEMSEYQFVETQRFNQNANFTGSMGSNGGVGEMSEYQFLETQRFNQNANFTGSMGSGNGGGVGEMSEYQFLPTNRFNQNANFTGSMGSNGGVGEMSEYQFLETQRFNQNANFTGSMGGAGGVGEMSEYQFLETQRFNQNANFTGAIGGGNNTGEVSQYQFTPTNRFGQNANFTGSIGGGNNTGEVSQYQFTATNRFDQNDNNMGSMGGSATGEVSMYQQTPTNRIISNNLIGTGGDQIAGGGYWATVTNPMATMRVVSTDMTGHAGMQNMAGHIAQTYQNVPTYRQDQNFDYNGPAIPANSAEMTTSGSGERNMFFKNDKQALLERLPPTPVNAFVGPAPESMYSMTMKTIPSTVMTQMGSLPSTDYLPFSFKEKNIQIPSSYPAFNPVDMLQNNPYINNLVYQSKPNLPNQTIGYGSMNSNQQNTSGLFYQNSNYIYENE